MDKTALVPSSPFDSEEVEDARIAILGGNQTSSQLAKMKQEVEKQKRALSVMIEESKVDSARRIAQSLVALDDVLLDKKVLAAVKESIVNSKDPAKSYNEFAKARAELYNSMMKQQLSSADPESAANRASGRSIKVAVTDGNGTTMVSID